MSVAMPTLPHVSAQLPIPGIDHTLSQNLTDLSKKAGVKTR